MKKKEQGVLTIEASIVLIIFLLFILFLFGFARIYRAQNMVSHAVLQSADALALESYLRELAHHQDAEKIVELGNELTGVTSFNADNFTSLRAADISKLAKEKFIAAVADSQANADIKLKQLGVKNGLDGLDFSKSKMDLANNDVIVHVTYKLKMQTAFFGNNEITVTKAGKAKTFGDILFGIATIPNDERMGTASGGGSYKHGETIEIIATPQYGYYFDGWDDDGDGIVDYDVGDPVTTSKRTITVTDAKTYTAIFKNKGYAVITSVYPEGVAEITAGGVFAYGSRVELTVFNENPHYVFSGWTGELLQDLNGDGIEEKLTSLPRKTGDKKYIIPDVQGVYWITANYTPRQYRVTVEHNNGGSVKIDGDRISAKTITYPQEITLEASPSIGFAVDYWMKDGARLEGSAGKTIWYDLPVVGDVVYKVVFKSTKVKVTFLDADEKLIEELTLSKGQSFQSSKQNFPKGPLIVGKVLEGWYTQKAGTGTRYTSASVVNENVTLYAHYKNCTHKYVWQSTTPATCAVREARYYKCEWCGHEKKEEGGLAEHSWGRCNVAHPIKAYTFRCQAKGWNAQTNYWNYCETTSYYHSICRVCGKVSSSYWCGKHGRGATNVGWCPW